MGNVQGDARMSDAVYTRGQILDATLLYNTDGVLCLTKQTIEIHGLMMDSKAKIRKMIMPASTNVTAGRLIRLGFSETVRLVVFIGDSEGNLRCYNPAGGNLISRIPCAEKNSVPGQGHSGEITSIEKVEGEHIVTGGVDGTVRMWELNKGIEERVFRRRDGSPAGVSSLLYLPDALPGPAVAAAYTDKIIMLYSCLEGDEDGHRALTLSIPEPVKSITYLEELRLLICATGTQIVVWDLRFPSRFPSASAAVEASRIKIVPPLSLAGPWPNAPILLCGLNNGSVRAYAVVILPEFSRCELVPIYVPMPLFSEEISLLVTVPQRLTMLAASNNTVRIISETSIAGGIAGPVIVGGDSMAHLDDPGSTYETPLPIDPRVEELRKYYETHESEAVEVLKNLHAVSVVASDPKSSIPVSHVPGTLEEPDNPQNLLESTTVMMDEIFKRIGVTAPHPVCPQTSGTTNEDHILRSIVEDVSKDAFKRRERAQDGYTGIIAESAFGSVGSASVLDSSVPKIDHKSVYSMELPYESVQAAARAALKITFPPPPLEDVDYPLIMKLEGEKMFQDAEIAARMVKRVDDRFRTKVLSLCPSSEPIVYSKTDSDGNTSIVEEQTVDIVSALLDEETGVKKLEQKKDETLRALIASHERQLSHNNNAKDVKMQLTEEKYDGDRRFWAARFSLALSLHHQLRLEASEECRKSLFNAIVKILPSGTVGGNRYVTLPLFANPDDPDDKTALTEDPSNLLYPTYDLIERREVAARSIPIGIFDEKKATQLQHQYLIPCITLVPSGSDSKLQYVVTEKPPRMNLMKALGDPLRPLPAFPLPAAARFLYKIALTLAFLFDEKKSLVHRDIRPNNIMLRYRGGNEVELKVREKKKKRKEQETDTMGDKQDAPVSDEASPSKPVEMLGYNDSTPATGVKFKVIEPVLFHVGFMRSTSLNEPVELGTVFAAPEISFGSVSRYCDVWSLGVLLIKLLQPPPCAKEDRSGPDRNSQMFFPFSAGLSPDYQTRWDIPKVDAVRNSLLMQMANFCSDCQPAGSFNDNEAREFARQSRINVEDVSYGPLFNVLTGRHVDMLTEQHLATSQPQAYRQGMANAPIQGPSINQHLRTMLPKADDLTLSFITSCLQFYPKNRLSLDQVLAHPWFSTNGVRIDHEAILRLRGVDESRTKEGVIIGKELDIKDRVMYREFGEGE